MRNWGELSLRLGYINVAASLKDSSGPFHLPYLDMPFRQGDPVKK